MKLLLIIFVFVLTVSAQDSGRLDNTPTQETNLPAQPIGGNDLLSLSVYNAPEFSRTVRVSADGFIRLPMLKQRVKVQGLYPDEIETVIGKALGEEELLIEPFVTVTIAEYHSRPINVSGAVKMPLVFQADGPISLLEALARAQGLREDAGPEIILTSTDYDKNGQVTTSSKHILTRELIDAADPKVNLKLSGGEEIRVPEAPKIFVVGNVKKPGVFPIQNGRSDTTVLEAIALSEGLAPFSSPKAYICRRSKDGAKTEIPIELNKILQRKSPDVALGADDILYIPDNRGKRVSVRAIESVIGFTTTAGASALIYGSYH